MGDIIIYCIGCSVKMYFIRVQSVQREEYRVECNVQVIRDKIVLVKYLFWYRGVYNIVRVDKFFICYCY